jgi:hypothetical protein
MGINRIEITMIGGHGCDRVAREGEPLAARCGRVDSCPDCAAAELVGRLYQLGLLSLPGTSATFTHWPDTPEQVVDDMITGKRKSGQFPEAAAAAAAAPAPEAPAAAATE